MAVYDQKGNEITLAEMAQQIRDFLAIDAEHRPDVWVRPDVAEKLNAFREGHEQGYLAALEKYGPFALSESEYLAALKKHGPTKTEPAVKTRDEEQWVRDHYGEDARISGQCSCGRTMSGKPEEYEYEYHGGTHGYYSCRECGLNWIAYGNGAMGKPQMYLHVGQKDED